MQEQQRASKSKAKGQKNVQNRKWTKMTGDLKMMKSEKSQGKKLKAMDQIKNDLTHQLADLRLPQVIIPKFSIQSAEVRARMFIQISDGSVGYSVDKPILSGIHFSLLAGERIALMGENGSGKSTFIKAILGDESIDKTGAWYTLKREGIGYLDQHYRTLDLLKSVLETMSEIVPHWSYSEIRNHLNDFLFRKKEEVTAQVKALSGGEKVRLSLAQIAAKTPQLLILDEITNNLDLETKAHVIQVLQCYPGAMMIVSHEMEFLKEIGCQEASVEQWRS